MYDEIFQTMLPQSPVWTPAGDYWTITLPSITDDESIPALTAWGILTMTHIFRLGSLPSKVSPFLIRAIIEGLESLLDLDFINQMEPDCSAHLKKWIELDPNQVLSWNSDRDLANAVVDTLNMTVGDFSYAISTSRLRRTADQPNSFFGMRGGLTANGKSRHRTIGQHWSQKLFLQDEVLRGADHPHFRAFRKGFDFEFDRPSSARRMSKVCELL